MWRRNDQLPSRVVIVVDSAMMTGKKSMRVQTTV